MLRVSEIKSGQNVHGSENPYRHHSALIHGDHLAGSELEFLGNANHEYDVFLEGDWRPNPVALPCCIPHSARLKQTEKEL
jgi:hypothetical protein